jgi:hypothetical protein
VLPRRFRSSLAGAPCGPGRLAIGMICDPSSSSRDIRGMARGLASWPAAIPAGSNGPLGRGGHRL